MTSMIVVRWLMVALSFAIAVVLCVSGHVLLGVLLGALALSRVFLLVRMQQRRDRIRQRIRERRAGAPGARMRL